MRVFMLERPRLEIKQSDLDQLKSYGEITMLFETEHKRAGIFNTDEFVRDVINALCDLDYDPENDAFVLVGSIIATALTVAGLVAYLSRIRIGKARLLMFSAHLGSYQLREVSLDTLMTTNVS